MSFYLILAAYTLVVVLIALRRRNVTTNDTFIMGGRKAQWFGVGASIFSLIGGGEIVALTALGFVFGFSAIALFLGYALGFVVLGTLSKRIRAEDKDRKFVSLPDFIHARFGRLAGSIVFACSVVAFFALLMIQFSAGGKLVAALTSTNYSTAAIAIGLVVTVYLVIGGFQTVITTDVFQGIARFALVPVLVWALMSSNAAPTAQSFVPESMPGAVLAGLILTGFFSALASADVWQRVYAAETNEAAKWGLIFGAVLMLLFGFLLVYIGMSAKVASPTSLADDAFSTALASGIPQWVVTVSVALVLISVLSTADTEIFVISSLIGKEMGRDGFLHLSPLEANKPPLWGRLLVVVIGVISTCASLVFSEIIEIYVWLISLLLAIAPAVIAALVTRLSGNAVALAIIANVGLFGALASVGKLSADTAYLIVVPGFVLLLATQVFSKLRGGVKS